MHRHENSDVCPAWLVDDDAGHSLQLSDPVPDLYVPMLHSMHLLLSLGSAVYPGPHLHCERADAPALTANMFSGHCVQLADPDAALYV